MTQEKLNELASRIIGAAIEVHKQTGPGLLESVYEACLIEELKMMGIKAEQQVKLPIIYKGKELEKYYVVDILVENEIILELKCVQELHPIHEVQVVTYLKLANMRLGYLMNFNVTQMIKGIKRKVNNF
ncbi:MAG: GxxExxY protein [Saprospiraceae bacterium]